MSPDSGDREFERRVHAAHQSPVPVRPLADLEVVQRLARESAPRRVPDWLEWLSRPGTVSLSPAAAALGALLLVAAGSWLGARLPMAPRLQRAMSSGDQVIEFALAAPRASRVAVVGDFNGWDAAATPMRRLPDGRWTAAIAVSEGRYAYAFVIDGRSWVPDPGAPLAPDDGFGVRSSVLVVEPSRSS